MLGKTVVAVTTYLCWALRDAVSHGNMIAYRGALFDYYATKLVSHYYRRAYVVVYRIVKYVQI